MYWPQVVAANRAFNGPAARCSAYRLSPAFNRSRESNRPTPCTARNSPSCTHRRSHGPTGRGRRSPGPVPVYKSGGGPSSPASPRRRLPETSGTRVAGAAISRSSAAHSPGSNGLNGPPTRRPRYQRESSSDTGRIVAPRHDTRGLLTPHPQPSLPARSQSLPVADAPSVTRQGRSRLSASFRSVPQPRLLQVFGRRSVRHARPGTGSGPVGDRSADGRSVE